MCLGQETHNRNQMGYFSDTYCRGTSCNAAMSKYDVVFQSENQKIVYAMLMNSAQYLYY